MKILFDYQTFTEQFYGGISRYFSEIIRQMESDPKIEVNIASLLSNNFYLNHYGLNNHEFFPSLEFKGKRKLMTWVNRAYAKKLINQQDFDLFHPTYYDPYFLDVLQKKPYVITVHDLIYEIFENTSPDYQKIKNNIRHVTQNADHIIAISENTKNDIIRFYSIDKNKISVVYHGYSFYKSQNKKNDISNRTANYFLFVGKRNGYKNFETLVKAISELLLRENYLLICAGGGEAGENEKLLLNSFNLQNHVIFMPRITDQKLMDLYSNAIAFIFPSRYEGFGIPILEAMSCGCPVLLSNTGSFLEIAGDAGIYFDPYNCDSISDCVHSLINSEEKREHLIKNGYQRVKNFTWEKTFHQTLDVYKTLI